jgi:hypothetical protein
LCLSAQAVIVVTERNSSNALIERIKQVSDKMPLYYLIDDVM